MNDISNDLILEKFPPILRDLIKEIWVDGKVGICSGNIQILRYTRTKDEEYDLDKYMNRLTISIPYAGHCVQWEIIFNNDDLSFAPDFDFEDDTFLVDPDVTTLINHVPSLIKWNPDEPKSLMFVIRELLSLYKHHHIKLLENEKFSRLHFEYSSLVCETGVNMDDIEVLVEPSGVVHFLISIPIDFSSLPPYIQATDLFLHNPGPDMAMLMVTFYRLDGSKTHPQLYLSPHVEQVFGNMGNKHIPPFPVEGCLMDYVPEVRKILTDKVQDIVTNYNKKNEYITMLLAIHGCSIIEYDSLTFSKATLLFETKNFYWLLIINVGRNFPKEKPQWFLRSLYHTTFDKPYTEQVEDYPYSPRWSMEVMVQRTFTYVLERISSFQNNSKHKSQM